MIGVCSSKTAYHTTQSDINWLHHS